MTHPTTPRRFLHLVAVASLTGLCHRTTAAENWPQWQFDGSRSGNVTERQLPTPLKLVGSVPMTDAVFTSPAIVDGRAYIVDGSGVVKCIDVKTARVVWQQTTDGGAYNCNNVSSPAVVSGYVHFGTTGGNYYVLRTSDGSVAAKIPVGEPIFSAAAIAPTNDAVYFATLGSRVYRVSPDGKVAWTWDFVREVLKFAGDRFNGGDWAQRGKRVTWREQFVCSRDIAVHGKTLVIPAGGTVVWLDDLGDRAKLRAGYAPNESPATYGLSVAHDGSVYRQWYRRDNTGAVERLQLDGAKVKATTIPGTLTSYQGDEGVSVSAVALRGDEVLRTRPEQGFALCRHAQGKTERLGAYPSIAPPVLVGGKALVAGLDGALYAVDLSARHDTWSFRTPFGRPLTAPPAVADGHVVFGGEDGYVYLLGPQGTAALPTVPLDLHRVRAPLSSKLADAKYDWFTNFGNQSNTNHTDQPLAPPLSLRWIRRVEGTIKHASVHGGGRMYTHTSEGQIFAVEQETGRLLWRVFYPGVHASYTAPAYHDGKLLVPQAGFRDSRVRCLDAATGKLLWEAPFTGSPSWNRQLPPLVHNGRVFYCFSTGQYTGRDWLFEHQNTRGFPADHKPLVRAWDLATGRELWTRDFSADGSGGDDAGLCLMEGVLYYSCYFGNKQPPGITAALDPATGNVRWKNAQYAVHGGCTISAKNGRLYLGGYNAPPEPPGRKTEADKPASAATAGKKAKSEPPNRIWCLDARDGSLVWQSDPLGWAIHVATLGEDSVFTHHQYRHGTLLDLATGRKRCDLVHGYNCTRFTMCGQYLLGANMDVYDTANGNRLVSTGPAVDVILCTGAHVSNGRVFFTANGGGLQLSMNHGEEARQWPPPWRTAR